MFFMFCEAGRYGPYGQTATSSFVWNVPNADREMGLLYFTGRA